VLSKNYLIIDNSLYFIVIYFWIDLVDSNSSCFDSNLLQIYHFPELRIHEAKIELRTVRTFNYFLDNDRAG